MSRFTVTATSYSALRAFEHHRVAQNQEEELESAFIGVKNSPIVQAGSRTDLHMKLQQIQAAQHAAHAHAAWVEKHKQEAARDPLEEKHYLKILVKTAVLRQRETGSTALSQLILSRNPQNDEAQTAGAQQNKKFVSEADAFDLNFVAKKLVEDIDIVLKSHGYTITLATFGQLNPWATE